VLLMTSCSEERQEAKSRKGRGGCSRSPTSCDVSLHALRLLISRLHLRLCSATMRIQYFTPLLFIGVALAAPPPFLVQGSQQLNLPAGEAELPHLSAEQFLDIVRAKAKAEQVMHSLVDRLEEAVTQMKEDVAQPVQDVDEAAATGLPPHHPPSVIDFSDYTILEILNASLHHHPDHEHKDQADAENLPKWKLPWTPKQPQHHPPEHEHDPKYLPLHRLGWFVNQSEEAQKALSKGEVLLKVAARVAERMKAELSSRSELTRLAMALNRRYHAPRS
jgi:hypothetical protein